MPLRRSTRERRSALPYDYIAYLQEHESSTSPDWIDVEKDEFEHIVMEDDPVNFHQIMESANSQQFLEAMNEEMQSMKDNDVWDLVALLEGIKPIGNKWILKTKKDSNGNMDRFKAHLVVQGFTQKEGVDYKETFLLVSLKVYLRIIMALLADFDLKFIRWM